MMIHSSSLSEEVALAVSYFNSPYQNPCFSENIQNVSGPRTIEFSYSPVYIKANTVGFSLSHTYDHSVFSFFPDILIFKTLKSGWHVERGATSSISKMVMCPSYQRIIAMGERAVPLILREMEIEGDDPDHWFWALEMITGHDPVPQDAYGDTVAMAQAWLTWAQWNYVW